MSRTISEMESEVRSYCRSYPAVFTKARGHELKDESGDTYIDFFAGAGALNYGHNDPLLKERLIDYLRADGLTHGLDFASRAKERFLEAFGRMILDPRGLDYRTQFVGPTGTNAIEAALKLARKVTGRKNVISFTGAFHGMTLGSLSVTANRGKRGGAGIPLQGAVRMPYDGYLGPDLDTASVLARFLEDPGSGIDKPAAIILETLQAEGGVRPASTGWLQRLAALAKQRDILLIVDDIQVGCGRTGKFFSFEEAGLEPDIVCLSKSLSGYGLPFAVTLARPELDEAWSPGEHNGTFRGNNLAFVTATAALERYWETDELERETARKGRHVAEAFAGFAKEFGGASRGRGLIVGLELEDPDAAGRVARAAFGRGLLIETAGPRDEVLKALPPLTIEQEALDRGLEILEACLRSELSSSSAGDAETEAAEGSEPETETTEVKG